MSATANSIAVTIGCARTRVIFCWSAHHTIDWAIPLQRAQQPSRLQVQGDGIGQPVRLHGGPGGAGQLVTCPVQEHGQRGTGAIKCEPGKWLDTASVVRWWLARRAYLFMARGPAGPRIEV